MRRMRSSLVARNQIPGLQMSATFRQLLRAVSALYACASDSCLCAVGPSVWRYGEDPRSHEMNGGYA